MVSSKNKTFPIIITILIIVVIIYLFATAKQPVVVCDKEVKDDFGIIISERIEAGIDGNKIENMSLTKTIMLPENYLEDGKQLDEILFLLEKSYQYLSAEEVSVSKNDNSAMVRIEIDDNETIILNNIEFLYNEGLEMKINSNTKSSGVITLRIKDNYTEGQLMTRLKNRGYSCK